MAITQRSSPSQLELTLRFQLITSRLARRVALSERWLRQVLALWNSQPEEEASLSFEGRVVPSCNPWDMEVGLTVTHHDHAYVEQRGGWELYTHLRGAESRMRFREEAIRRAERLYDAACEQSAPTPETNGLALLILQRTFFAVEDFGGLLHAFLGPDPWARLISTSISDLDEAFRLAAHDPSRALEPFCLCDEEALEGEDLTMLQRKAAIHLAHITAIPWRNQLDTVIRFWARYHDVAKATMHGSPILAGEHVLGPPPAGVFAEGISDAGAPFAVLVKSAIDHKARHVVTDRFKLQLDERSVRGIRRAGTAATRLTRDLCQQQARSIKTGHACGIPFRLLHRLPQDEQAALRALPND